MVENSDTRSGKMKGVSWTTILVVLNLIAFNLISLEHFTRWDFTETSMYTLSEDTARVLDNLSDAVTVKVFMSDDLPVGYVGFRRMTEDLLEEFKVAAGDKMNLIYISTNNPDSALEASGYGITPVPVSSMSADRSETVMVHMGIAVLYEGRYDSIPFLGDCANLEYDLLMTIARVFRRVPVTIAFYELPEQDANLREEQKAENEMRRRRKNRHSIEQDLKSVSQYLVEKCRYDVITVDLKSGVPDEVSTLILTNAHLIDDVAMYFIDQFLMRGGKVVFLRSGVRVDAINLHCRSGREDLDDWLAHYGIVIEKNLILDRNCLDYAFTAKSPDGRTFLKPMPFPPYIKVLQRYFNFEHPVTAPLINDMYMYYASSLELAPPDGGNSAELLRSSLNSWEQRDAFEIHPERIVDPGPGSYNQFVLAGIMEGTFSSYYTLRSVTDEVLKAAARKKGRISSATKYMAKMAPEGAGDEDAEEVEGIPEKSPEESPEEPPEESPDSSGGSGRERDVPGGGLQEDPAPGADDPAGGVTPGDDPAAEAGVGGLVHPKDIVLQSPETAIVVISCEDFISNPKVYGLPQETQTNMLYGFYSAVQFFSNVVDYLSLGGGFSTIRARQALPRNIDPEFNDRPNTVFLLKLVGTMGGALIAILLGVVLVFLRKASRRKEVVL